MEPTWPTLSQVRLQQLMCGPTDLHAREFFPYYRNRGGKRQESPTEGDLAITHSTVALGREPAGHVNLRKASVPEVGDGDGRWGG